MGEVMDLILIGGSCTVLLHILLNIRSNLLDLLQSPQNSVEESDDNAGKIIICQGDNEEEEGTKSNHRWMEYAVVAPHNGVYKMKDDMIE
eukprot:7168304-Ditylum_brightwellii.AAC.1